MIIVGLKGGLGNQLFQYACGKALSLRNGEPLKLDITGYEKAAGTDTPRSYSLSRFNISCGELASNEEIRRLKYPLGLISKVAKLIDTKILRRFNVNFDQRIYSAKGSLYLDGFWQTEKYFKDVEGAIRREFTLNQPLSERSQAVLDLIRKADSSVSLHVRRGDVARDAAFNPYYGITTAEYYAAALEYISEHTASSRVFVFSDDIEWAKQNIPIRLPVTYVSGDVSNGSIPDYEELILMSMCDHNIIANSSFSWWGAWLNPNPNKIIIAPKQWIRKKQWQHKDTCPSSWIRV